MHEYVCANLNPKPNIIWNMYLRKQTGLHGLYECPLMCESSTRHLQMNIKSIMSVPEMCNEIYVCVFGASEICKQTERERDLAILKFHLRPGEDASWEMIL